MTIYVLNDGQFGGPEIAPMAGERSPTILPEMVIRWQPILDKLTQDDA